MSQQGIEMTRARPAAPALDLLDAIRLDEIKARWESAYDIGMDGTVFCAVWLFGDSPLLLTADSPAGLDSAIRADWHRRGGGAR